MAYKWMSQEQIDWNWELNPNDKHDDHIRALAKHMNNNGYDPKFPIIVYEIEGHDKYLAATGHHRLEASLLQDDEFPNLPLTEVYVEIVEGDYKQYIRRMLIDNHQHVPGFNKYIGRTPTRIELRTSRFRLMFFPDVFEKGDRLLAKEWGCDGDTVGKMREAIISDVRNGNNLRTSNAHAAHITDTDIEKIKQIIKDDLYLGIDGKKHPRTKQVIYKPTTERSTAGIPAPEEDTKAESDNKINVLGKWNSQVLHRLSAIFQAHGVSPNSATANIGRAIKKFYGKIPFEMSDDELRKLMSESWRVNEHPNNPEWWEVDGEQIEWAHHVLSLAKTEEAPAEQDEVAKLEALHEEIKKQLRKNPDMEAESLAVAFSEDVEVVKTILAWIESGQERKEAVSHQSSAVSEEDNKQPAQGTADYDKALWNSKHLPRLVDMFIEKGVSKPDTSVKSLKDYVTWEILEAIKIQYGKQIVAMNDSGMTMLIDEANIVHQNAENPDLWVWNTGEKIEWALHVLSLAKHPADLPEPEYVEPVSEDITDLDIRRARSNVSYISIKWNENGYPKDMMFEDDSRYGYAQPLTSVPDDILVQLLRLAKASKEEEK